MKDVRLNVSWREADAMQCVVGPGKEALRVHYVRLWRGRCSGDPRILKMSGPGDGHWEKLQARNRAGSQERLRVLLGQSCRSGATLALRSSESPWTSNIRHQAAGFDVFSDGFWCCFILIVPYYAWSFHFGIIGDSSRGDHAHGISYWLHYLLWEDPTWLRVGLSHEQASWL